MHNSELGFTPGAQSNTHLSCLEMEGEKIRHDIETLSDHIQVSGTRELGLG